MQLPKLSFGFSPPFQCIVERRLAESQLCDIQINEVTATNAKKHRSWTVPKDFLF